MTYSQFKKFQKLNTKMKLINAFIVGSLARNSRSYGSHSAYWCRGCCSVQGRRQGLFFTAGYLRFLLMVINDGKRASEAAIVQKEAAQ
ncbi:MAG TPA: hypothetical protein DEA94_04700 [Rhodobacteraceae bacterium]|nr:hypothetical protein [Paracoccaceae bacterium]